MVLRRNRPHSVGSEGSRFGDSRAGHTGVREERHSSFLLQHIRLTKKYDGGPKSQAPVPFFLCVPRCDHFVDAPTGYRAVNIEAFFFLRGGGSSDSRDPLQAPHTHTAGVQLASSATETSILDSYVALRPEA